MEKFDYSLFRDEVANEIKEFSQEQLVHFAWLCGVRALPFLCVEKGFSYWMDKKQTHLNSIFYALDVCSVTFRQNAVTSSYNHDVAFFAASDAAGTAANAVFFAIASNDDVYASDDANAALSAKTIPRFHEIIRSDINAIRENKLTAINNGLTIYGQLWHDFLDALNDIDCGYWAKLYEDLFKNRFVIDDEELIRRLAVPEEIRAEGAAKVGQYLDATKDIETQNLSEARIIILGEKGAGKTSLARRLVDVEEAMPKSDESTIGVITNIWKLPSQDGQETMNVHIWDFAGHAITHSAHRLFMSTRCLYIYVYNGRTERNNDPRYWLEQIKMYGGGESGDKSPALFLINRQDEHVAEVEEEALKSEYPFIEGNFHNVNISNKDTTELEAFRQTVINLARNNPSWNN